jgi:hypothetical protein
MKHLIRKWLGIPETDFLAEFKAIHTHLSDLHVEMIGMRSDLVTTFKDEFDPKRKEMSDKLGEQVIKRLKAEDWARKHTEGQV